MNNELERMGKQLATKNHNKSGFQFTFWDIRRCDTSWKLASIDDLKRVEEVAEEGNELKLKPQTVGESSILSSEAGVSSISKRVEEVAKDGKELKLKPQTVGENSMLIAEADVSPMSVSGAAAHPDFDPFLVDESDVYGRQEIKDRIVDSLTRPNYSSKKNCSFVFIKGMQGMGKTTLAMLIYRDQRVREYFQIQSWAPAPLNCNFDGVMRELIECNTDESAFNLTAMALVRRCKKLLWGKKCLFVLDDLQWTPENASTNIATTKNLLEAIRMLFDNCAKGSKILVTTRDVKISMGSNELMMI